METKSSLPTKGLTATILFEAQSLNYDEGYGNLSLVKKLHRGSGEVFTYASRQSLRYSIFMQGVREFGWTPSDVEERGSGEQKVTQLTTEIDKSEEGDLFGYMRTNVPVAEGKEVSVLRTSPVRLLPAIALEPFASDLEMLTNKYQADKRQLNPNIANMEVHRSLYRYTVCIDLHRVGTESDEIGTRISPGKTTDPKHYAEYETRLRGLFLEPKRKAIRVKQLLEVIKTLYRDIKGRREDLKPLFIIGGVYDTCNPFFENLVEVDWKNGKPRIIPDPLQQLLSGTYATMGKDAQDKPILIQKNVKKETVIGIRSGKFANGVNDFEKTSDGSTTPSKENLEVSPEDAIGKLQEMVEEYYGVKESTSKPKSE